MKSLKQLQQELGLTNEQAQKISEFINELVIEMLDSLKEDTIANFEETAEALKKIG